MVEIVSHNFQNCFKTTTVKSSKLTDYKHLSLYPATAEAQMEDPRLA
jgi:hypothetical protein